MVTVKKAMAYFEEGKSAQKISKMAGMPSVKTINRWIEQEHGGKWLVPVRKIRSFVNPQELEMNIELYFLNAYEEKGHWSNPLELSVFDEHGNEMLGERRWIPDLDRNGNPIYMLKKPLSWAGLAISIKVSVKTLTRYRNGYFDTEDCFYSEILEMAEDRIREFNIMALYSKETVNGAKFILGRAKAFKKDFKEGEDKENDKSDRKLEDWFTED